MSTPKCTIVHHIPDILIDEAVLRLGCPVFYRIAPVPKPRMTARDRWKKRPEVLRFFAFRDEVKLRKLFLPVPYKVVFYIEMPTSWSKNKRKLLDGQPHLVRPDKDNYEKALLDSVFGEDKHVWSGWSEKRWSILPGIQVFGILEKKGAGTEQGVPTP